MKTCIKALIERIAYLTLDTLTAVPLARIENGWVHVEETMEDWYHEDYITPCQQFTKWGCFVDWADTKLETILYRYTNALPF